MPKEKKKYSRSPFMALLDTSRSLPVPSVPGSVSRSSQEWAVLLKQNIKKISEGMRAQVSSSFLTPNPALYRKRWVECLPQNP